MALRQPQKDRILEQRKKYLSALVTIMQERRELEHGLQVSQQHVSACVSFI